MSTSTTTTYTNGAPGEIWLHQRDGKLVITQATRVARRRCEYRGMKKKRVYRFVDKQIVQGIAFISLDGVLCIYD